MRERERESFTCACNCIRTYTCVQRPHLSLARRNLKAGITFETLVRWAEERAIVCRPTDSTSGRARLLAGAALAFVRLSVRSLLLPANKPTNQLPAQLDCRRRRPSRLHLYPLQRSFAARRERERERWTQKRIERAARLGPTKLGSCFEG